MAVLEQHILDGLGAVHEQAAIKAVLFLGDPIAFAIAADEYEGKCSGTARGRFDELHVSGPSKVLESDLLLARRDGRQAGVYIVRGR
jgi:hypothetical protein